MVPHWWVGVSFLSILLSQDPVPGQTLPDTKPLTRQGDLAAQMVEGIDHYLMRETEAAFKARKQVTKQGDLSPEAYARSLEPKRKRLATILGVVDKRLSGSDLEY